MTPYIGIPPVLQQYVHEQTTCTTIVKSLHDVDEGRLGNITGLMLLKQITYLGMVTGMQNWRESMHCSLACKIAFMHDAGNTGVNLEVPIEIGAIKGEVKGIALNNVMKRLQSTILKGHRCQ